MRYKKIMSRMRSLFQSGTAGEGSLKNGPLPREILLPKVEKTFFCVKIWGGS